MCPPLTIKKVEFNKKIPVFVKHRMLIRKSGLNGGHG